MEKEIKHISGSAGGFLVGRSHANNGIKAINKATGQPLEMEGGEVVITKTAVEDEELREFEGEMLTNRQILSRINESGGGVSFALGGDIPTELYFDEKEYSYGGEKLPGHVIAYKISSCGCNQEPQTGLSEGKTIEDIAAMHNVSVSHIENQIEKGIKVEAEHTSNPQEQVKIAMDHLVENPNYYDILAEAHLAHGGNIKKGAETDDLDNLVQVSDDVLDAPNVVSEEATTLFAEGGQVINPIVEDWDDVPANYKNTNKVKKVNFANNPIDKGLDSIISPFLGSDILRPIMSTIHFDKNGITATNAHILITLPYPNEKYEGSYDINRIKKEKSSELLLLDETYPSYEKVIPLSENAKYVYKIDVYKLLQYAQTAINYSNKVTYQAVFKFGDNEKIGFNLNFLQIILKTWLKLGHEEIYISMTMPNRAAVFSPSKNYEVGKDEIILLMPTMVGYGMKTKEEDIHFGAMDIDYGRHLKAYYDFNDGEIHNSDGSIANFQMQYSNNLGISEDYLALLQKMTSKSRTLAILNYVKVVDGKMYATDLKTSLIVKNVDLKDGIYEIINKAPNITMYPIEDFPKERIFNENEFQTIGNVFNGPNETPGEKRYSSFQFKISSEAFEFYLDKLLLSVGKDDLRPTMMGVCIHKTAENQIFLVSTDSNTLCKIDITEYCTFKKDDRKLEYIMSISYFKEAFDLIEGDITVKCSYSNIFIESENLDIISKNEDGKYPNYEAVIPYRNSNIIKFKHAEISKCLKEKPTLDFVNKYKSEKGKAFYITNSGEKIFLVLASESYGSANVSTIFDKLELCSIDLQYTEENTTVSFDDSLFLMMPMRLAAFENQYFAFKKNHFEIMLKTITDTEITCYYSEVFKPYLFPIEEVKFNKTLPEEKTKFQKDNVIVDKNIKPKTASGVGVATTEKTRGAEAVVLEPQNSKEEISSTIEAINLILPSLRGKEKTEAKDTIVALYLLMGKDYETEQKISALKEKLSTLKDKLHDAKIEANQKFSNLGWGAGMRKSKLNVSTKKEDSIQARINKIEDELKSLQNLSSFEKGGPILLAPNGKPSNLDAEMYYLVRTPQFKAWFGDWENDPQNASKVVDENGEPLIVYHGTFQDFYEFNKSEIASNSGNYGHYGYGFYFSDDLRESKHYGNKIIYSFLNIRKPFTATTEQYLILKELGYDVPDYEPSKIKIDSLLKHYKKDKNIYNFIKDFKEIGYEKAWENLHDRKASEEERDFFNDLGFILDYTEFGTHDGVPLEDLERLNIKAEYIYDFEYNPSLHYVLDVGNYSTQFTDDIKKLNFDGVIYGSEYVAFEPNQIKLADGTNTTFDANTNDIRYEKGGPILLAPNGKPSNLDAEMYQLVRTPQFKAWFGDWENAPEKASKVVDENGEPKIVYHGSKIDFFEFDKEKIKDSLKWEKGFYFTDNFDYAKSYANSLFSKEKNRNPRPFFLNIKDIYAIHKNSDRTEYVAFEPNQIKLADGTNTTFDANTNDIRYEKGGVINKEYNLQFKPIETPLN